MKNELFKKWERESLDSEYDNRCGECRWFDPAYDQCCFFGATRVDDIVCGNFKYAE